MVGDVLGSPLVCVAVAIDDVVGDAYPVEYPPELAAEERAGVVVLISADAVCRVVWGHAKATMGQAGVGTRAVAEAIVLFWIEVWNVPTEREGGNSSRQGRSPVGIGES